MPSKAIIYGIGIFSIIIIIGGTVSWIIANSSSTTKEPLPTLNPGEEYSDNSGDVSPTDSGPQVDNDAPTASSEEQICEGLMTFLQTNHPETSSILPSSTWTGGLQLNEEGNLQFYVYNNSGWEVTLELNDELNSQYNIKAIYNNGAICWEGIYNDEGFAENSFSSINLPSPDSERINS